MQIDAGSMEHSGAKRSDWAFTAKLWLLRWAIVLPVGWFMMMALTEPGARYQGSANLLTLVGFLLIAPIIETVLECLVPWLLLALFTKPPHRGLFIAISAGLMAILHSPTITAITLGAITGVFLALVFSHFAVRSKFTALIHTMVFHSAINLVGWIFLLFWQS